MSSNNNFLLKIHMEEEENTTEIYLNKERRSFTFINDECISDLIIPEFKITSLNMILANVSDDGGDDTYYAEYEKDNEIVREYDREKINILSSMVTKISINDFLDYQKDIKINDYYVDNVIDAYECVLPTEMKKILSYTTNGVVFNGEEIIYFMPHEDITSYSGPIQNFIPFMIRKGKSYIGYDFKESLYKEYLEKELIKEGTTLEEVLGVEEIELIGEEEPVVETKEETEELELIGKMEDESNLVQEKLDDCNDDEEIEIITNEEEQAPLETHQEKVSDEKEEYEDTIKNIDYQFERLNTGIVKKEKKEPYQYKEKEKEKVQPEVDEQNIIKKEIRDGIRKSLEEMEKTNDIIDEIDNDIERVIKKAKKIKENKNKKEKIVISDEIGKEAEEILQKLNAEIAQLEEAKQKAKKEKIVISDEVGKEAEEILQKLNAEIKKMKKNKKDVAKKEVVISEKIGKEAATILEKLNAELAKPKTDKKDKVVISDEIGKEAAAILEKLNAELAKPKTDKNDKVVISDEISKEAAAVLAKLNTEIAQLEENKQQYNKDKKDKVVISDEIGKEAEEILQKLNAEINATKTKKVVEVKDKVVVADEISKEAEEILQKLNAELAIIEENKAKEKIKKEKEATKAKEDKKDILSLSELINNSINNALDNYMINFNDTQKLIVEHLPYYEFTNDFSVIQIPEIDLDKITLLPNSEINLGKLKLIVDKLSEDKVDFLVQSSTSIVDKDGNKIKKGDHLVLNLENELALRLNKKSAMETWSIRMEKSTFEKELRNIDFKKVMNYIIELDSYKQLGNIEKYELQKSLMLFIDLVMENKEESVLEELYKILEKKPTLYEEHITKYNNKCSLTLKDTLKTYEEKKAYLIKLNYVNGLIEAKWLDYPRYIFNSHNYFYNDDFLEEFINELDSSLKENDFYDYLMKLFNEYGMFKDLPAEGQENLKKCVEYLSVLYKERPDLGEDNKYKIERTFMIGATEEEMALLISKLCRRGIKDYSTFVEYDYVMKEKYRLGELKYPIFSEYFEIEEIRNGGEYDEF